MGMYDVPASIDKILSIAKDYEKVNYVGYS